MKTIEIIQTESMAQYESAKRNYDFACQCYVDQVKFIAEELERYLNRYDLFDVIKINYTDQSACIDVADTENGVKFVIGIYGGSVFPHRQYVDFTPAVAHTTAIYETLLEYQQEVLDLEMDFINQKNLYQTLNNYFMIRCDEVADVMIDEMLNGKTYTFDKTEYSITGKTSSGRYKFTVKDQGTIVSKQYTKQNIATKLHPYISNMVARGKS